MNIELRKIGVLLVGGALIAVAAPSAFADGNCLRIKSWAVFDNPLGEPDCGFEEEAFAFCLEGKVRGTLKGTWKAFGNADWFVDLTSPAFPVPEETLSNYNREFNVFSTRKGKLIGDSQYVFDIRIFDAGGGFVSPVMIERGTGMFEGATGWIAGVFTDSDLSRAILLGEVCGPRVRGRDDDDDNNSD